ncbi:hypothetical protein [Herbidospora daliensis]|uniref:hypothetical protein n=1 Tax=Herbidospora daliensis TaxID=295585 RepID=UPI000B250CAD|nr:hypothetical protein [Herbidospora daliensis]
MTNGEPRPDAMLDHLIAVLSQLTTEDPPSDPQAAEARAMLELGIDVAYLDDPEGAARAAEWLQQRVKLILGQLEKCRMGFVE